MPLPVRQAHPVVDLLPRKPPGACLPCPWRSAGLDKPGNLGGNVTTRQAARLFPRWVTSGSRAGAAAFRGGTLTPRQISAGRWRGEPVTRKTALAAAAASWRDFCPAILGVCRPTPGRGPAVLGVSLGFYTRLQRMPGGCLRSAALQVGRGELDLTPRQISAGHWRGEPVTRKTALAAAAAFLVGFLPGNFGGMQARRQHSER